MSIGLSGLSQAYLSSSDLLRECPDHHPVWAYLWVNIDCPSYTAFNFPVSSSLILSNYFWFWWPNLVSKSFFLGLPPGFVGIYFLRRHEKNHLFIWEWKVSCTSIKGFKSSLVSQWIYGKHSEERVAWKVPADSLPDSSWQEGVPC